MYIRIIYTITHILDLFESYICHINEHYYKTVDIGLDYYYMRIKHIYVITSLTIEACFESYFICFVQKQVIK